MVLKGVNGGFEMRGREGGSGVRFGRWGLGWGGLKARGRTDGGFENRRGREGEEKRREKERNGKGGKEEEERRTSQGSRRR